MNAARGAKRAIARTLYALVNRVAPAVYAQDGLISVHSHAFMQDPAFLRAYARGVQAIGGTDTYRWHWRIHVGLWAAKVALALAGDFVECGVNRGFLSSAIMEHLDWNSLERDFFLLDTFTGLDPRFVSDMERERGALRANIEHLRSGFYVRGVEKVRANFAEWPRARIIEGPVPDTLKQVTSSRIAFLHLDMNSAPPEVAAITWFWERLVPGAPVLLDDYAYLGYTPQRLAMDEFARTHGVAVCSLPTGQGLILKPPLALSA
ncbi:MAG TPA: TylF/MycF/NovP-related O-methyltransferase [Steroidobacteraceae bacterium]|nr:TylF/MycF/NovP-related O-methyltransferase [Steroidobacteraceae bacterium]